MGRTTKTKDKVKLHKTIESRTDFFYYTFRNVLLFGIPLLIISGLVLSHLSFHSSASNYSIDSVNLSIDTSCTISGTEIDPHSANLNGGLHKENIGTTKIGIFCNDNNGYNIYAIGYSNNTDGNTDLVSNLSSNYNIKTGIYSSSNITSSWSMKLTSGTGTGINPDTGASVPTTPPTINNNYDTYNIIPENYTLVASRPSGTNINTDINVDITGSYLTTTYDIYANSAQAVGTYIGKVKYIVTHPNTNTPSTINDLDAAFAIAGKPKIYYNQSGNGPYFSMQDMTSDICNSVTRTGEPTTTQLVDIRDNNLYYVTKLADGKCWMTQNLDLAIGSTNVPLTSENTDISTDSSTYTSSGIYSDYTANNGVYTWNPVSTAITTISGWAANNVAPYSAEGGDIYYYTSGNDNNDTRYDSLSLCATNGRTEAECRHYHVGNYYNWTAAAASNNSTNISTDNSRAANSICPKGWRLPNTSTTNNEYNEFGKLFYQSQMITSPSNGSNSITYQENGLNSIRSNPYYFVRPGYVNGNSTLTNSGINGYYWSSTINSNNGAYDLLVGNNNLSPANRSFYGRVSGFSVRCIAR